MLGTASAGSCCGLDVLHSACHMPVVQLNDGILVTQILLDGIRETDDWWFADWYR